MPSDAMPDRLGQYEITRRLALGGMAEVFLGKLRGAEGFTKDVVVKRILPQHSENVDFVTMFRDEARITSQLFHGNIIQVIEFGVADGHHYLVLEYVNGPSLSTTLSMLGKRSLRLSVVESAHIAAEVARALDYAHRKRGTDGEPLNVVHRDVTPSNILLSREGEVKLADFGIARARARLATTAVGSGVVKGKLAYMAPETINSGKANSQTDIFSLGAVLYCMLTGTPPFSGESEALTIAQIIGRDPPPPSHVNPEVSPELDEIVAKLLAKEPAERPERAQWVADALSRFIPLGESPAEMLAKTLAAVDERHASATRPRLLIVHESRTVRAVLRTKLDQHYSVDEATSTEQALVRVKTEPADVILCQRTPSGGPEPSLARHVTEGLGSRLVVLASQDTHETRVAAAARGAHAVATPAMSTEELLMLLGDASDATRS